MGFFYIIGDELAGYVVGLITGGIFAFFALRIPWTMLKRFLGAVGNAFKALMTNDTVAPLNTTRTGSLSEEAGPWKGSKGVGTALRAVAAAALVLVVSVLEFFSFLF